MAHGLSFANGIALGSDGYTLFVNETGRDIDPLMGWTGSDDTQAQVRMRFATRDEAVAYAKEHGLDYVVVEPNKRGLNIRPRGYGENFAPDRRAPWTH